VESTSLCFPIAADGRVLLGQKKRGFGSGKWNGFGGKRKSGESFADCAVRELREESGLIVQPEDLIQAGYLDFRFPYSSDLSHDGWIYLVKKWQGNIIDTSEMAPQWFDISQIPYDHMWKADRAWLPQVLKGKLVIGYVSFGDDNDSVWDVRIKGVDSFD
jgi:8-oxo-dGTP diphosphatase